MADLDGSDLTHLAQSDRWTGPPLERPQDLPDLLRRIQGAVAQLTHAPHSLWENERGQLDPSAIHPVDLGSDGVLHLSRRTAEVPLEALTKLGQGPVDEEQVRAAQIAVQAVTAAFVWAAVPDDYTRADAELAEADLGRDAIASGTTQAFNQRIYNEVVDRVFPADLADRLRAAGSPYADVRFAPAAQAFAATVDALKQDSAPGETLRLMAGQGPAGIARAAAEQLASDIPAAARPLAVGAIAEQIDRDFDTLQGEVAPWTNIPTGELEGSEHLREQWARLSADHGQAIAQRAHTLAQEYANDVRPEQARGLDQDVDRLPAMADPEVVALWRKVNQVVLRDTGGWSLASDDELPGLREYDEDRLLRLAGNLDIPARLAPGPEAVLAAAGGRAADDRPEIRMDMQNLVADAAYSLGPQGAVPEPSDPAGRIALEKAICQAYAELATPNRLAKELFENGRADDVGMFPPPDEKGDAVAARALVLGITARTGLSEDEILTDLVSAGRGRIATEAARMLLPANENFATLAPYQKEAVVSGVAAELEKSFGTERDKPTVEGLLAETIQDRALAATWGAKAVDGASKEGNKQVASRHAPRPAERPRSVPELIERMRAAIAEEMEAPGTLWLRETAPMPVGRELDEILVADDAEDGTLYLHPDSVQWVLEKALADEPDQLTPERALAVREAMQAIGVALIDKAVPEGHTREDDEAAREARPEFDALAFGTVHGASEDYLNQVIARTLPADLTERVMASDPPFVDQTWAPAARGFAQSIDKVAGRVAQPSVTLGQLAGRDRAGIAPRAAELVVRAAGVPSQDRPAVTQEVAERVEQAFKILPDQVKAWREAGTTNGEELAAKTHQFGEALGAELYAIARAQAPQDPSMRFVPGRDPAAAQSATTKVPDGTSSADPAVAAGQSKAREYDGRI